MFSKVWNSVQNSVNALNQVSSAVSRANTIANANSARSADEARIQREWQEAQNAKAMKFNAAEAEKSRNWQEYMSNTAHQREIADLKAAGLNPVLSAMGGNGAAVTSGAQASGVTSAGAKGEVDTSANQAIVNLLGSMLGFMGNLASSSVSAQASMANAQRAAEATELVGFLSAFVNRYSADQHYAASKYTADQHYAASKYTADHSKFGVLGNALQALVDILDGGSDNGGSESVFSAANLTRGMKKMFTDQVDREEYPNGTPGSVERFLKSPFELLRLLERKSKG